jgi:multiple sugar transport system permease protein
MSTIPSTIDRAPAAPVRGVRHRRVTLDSILIYGLLIVLALMFLLPFYLIVRNAFMTNAQITAFEWKWLPVPPHFENFTNLFSDISAPMGNGIRNSAIIAVTQLIFQMLFASMAGYALARIPARGRNIVFFLILSTLMIPSAVTFVPTFVVVAFLGGVNTLWGIIVPGLFSAFATFLFRQFYLDFPAEIEEAGRVDGLGYFGIYWYLLLPNSIGILMALGVLTFIGSWNAFLWPLVIGQDPSSWTVQVVLSTFITAQTIDLGALFMGALVGILPLVIVFLIMQRYIVEGVKLSGVKG